MFTRVSRSGGRAYLQLVQAYRNPAGQPRQRVVANLGRLDQLSDADLQPLIGGLERALGRTPSATPQVVFGSSKAFGDLFALHALWAELGLSTALSRALRSSRRQFDAAALIRAMVFNRLCAPDSKLGVLRWLDTVAMPDVPETVTHDQLLRSMDALMDRVEAGEKAVAAPLRPLLDDTFSGVFYDLTTIRTSGTCTGRGDLSAHGLSKDTGGIARQFVLGVIQTAEGLPIAHQVHAGNTGEGSTLIPMIERTLKRYPVKRVVLVADRGLLSLDNLDQIEALQTPQGQPIEYILAVPGRRYGEFAKVIEETALADGMGETTWQSRRLIVAHDDDRAQHQQAARQATITQIQAEGERMAYVRFIEMVKAAGLSRIIKADLHADRFSFDIDQVALRAAEQLDGKLLLVTNTEFKPAEVITRYKALADIERGFRVLKSDIDIAPVHHRLPERIRAHALICFLALVLYRVLRQRLRASGSTVSPRRALAVLRQIQKHTVDINHKTAVGTGRLAPEQRDLFKALKLDEPIESTAV